MCHKRAEKIEKGSRINEILFYNINIYQFMYYFTASLSAFPGLKAGTLLAEISISSPVCGLRPLRAARSRNSDR